MYRYLFIMIPLILWITKTMNFRITALFLWENEILGGEIDETNLAIECAVDPRRGRENVEKLKKSVNMDNSIFSPNNSWKQKPMKGRSKQ